MYTNTIDSALSIRPELVVQVLQTIPPLEMEITDNVFKNKKTIYSDTCTKAQVDQIIQAVPYVMPGSDPPAITGYTKTYEALTVPPMEASQRVTSNEIKRVSQLNGQDYNAWLAEKMTHVKRTLQYNLEWYARHFLVNGSQNYKMLVNNNWHNSVYSLGSFATVTAPNTKFDDTGATLTGVMNHLDTMYKKNNDLGWFMDKNSIITYCRTEVFSAILNLMNSYHTTNVIGVERVDIDTIRLSGYLLKRFDGTRKDPETQANGASITAKRMLMIDVGAGAPHTMVNLELDNLNAVGGQRHVLVDVYQDPRGNWVDITVSWRPLGLLIPPAVVDSGDCLL